MIVPSINRGLLAGAGLFFWALGLLCAPAAGAKRVMILNPFSRDTAPRNPKHEALNQAVPPDVYFFSFIFNA